MVTAPPSHPRFPSVEQETLSVEAALSWYIDDYPGEAQVRGISAIVRVRDNQGNAVTDLTTDAFSFIRLSPGPSNPARPGPVTLNVSGGPTPIPNAGLGGYYSLSLLPPAFWYSELQQYIFLVSVRQFIPLANVTNVGEKLATLVWQPPYS
ncbi:hypothetical protein [Paraburkholderia flagellata]|uniref:hypothetical protein n=1 Tax=Paraburkholderia flagellata TaxID=2883241 RepID=UPI001F3043F3|nr:hypothetical protein [Paraburkholderia flagellata]